MEGREAFDRTDAVICDSCLMEVRYFGKKPTYCTFCGREINQKAVNRFAYSENGDVNNNTNSGVTNNTPTKLSRKEKRKEKRNAKNKALFKWETEMIAQGNSFAIHRRRKNKLFVRVLILHIMFLGFTFIWFAARNVYQDIMKNIGGNAAYTEYENGTVDTTHGEDVDIDKNATDISDGDNVLGDGQIKSTEYKNDETADLIVSPTPTETPVEEIVEVESRTIYDLLLTAKVYDNTIMNTEILNSEEEVNEYVRTGVQKYTWFSVFASDASYLHTAEEYKKIYPEIISLDIDGLDVYKNGICLTFTNVECEADANLSYAIRTGDTGVLREVEDCVVLSFMQFTVEALELDGEPDIEKVRKIHDLLLLYTAYDIDRTSDDHGHTPYELLFNQEAVCDGYARTFKLLLALCGIESKVQIGFADGEMHAWNLVKIDDEWYHIDVTWDDPTPDIKGRVEYTYFMRTDEFMSKTHSWHAEIKCTSNKYETYAYTQYMCIDSDTAKEVLDRQVSSNERIIKFFYLATSGLNESSLIDVARRIWPTEQLTYYYEVELGDYRLFQIENPYIH